MNPSLVVSCFQVGPVLAAWKKGRRCFTISPDLGISKVSIDLDSKGIFFPKGEFIPWQAIRKIGKSENGCFTIKDGKPVKIQVFSEDTNRLYSLMPTKKAPTMLISGILMHRIKGTDPIEDTLEKIKTIEPVSGNVLDTATGLGYTAIFAAKKADRVVTIELDPYASEIARSNPWSKALFENPKIMRRIGDSFDLIREFSAGSFQCIIHDPPVFALAPQLYSDDFYFEAYRVLKNRGKLFHYIGNPDTRTNRNMGQSVIKRLKKAGFSMVVSRRRAFGLVAFK